jgi:hypothetical protein
MLPPCIVKVNRYNCTRMSDAGDFAATSINPTCGAVASLDYENNREGALR